MLKRSKDVVYQALLLIETLGGSKNSSYVKHLPMIKPIFDMMKAEKEGSLIWDVSLRVLQVLSLDWSITNKMIELDAIKWVVNLLKIESNVLSDDNLEYAHAMLMNMTLRTSGKWKCEEISKDLLKVLNDNLEHENS